MKTAIAPSLSLPVPALSQTDLTLLKSPFSDDRLGVKVQSFSKDRTRAMLVQYLQHTDVQNRLDEVDPAWSIQVLDEARMGDTVYIRARLTVKGVTRENVGEGGDPKAAHSDALKRCAMLFGVGRYLYDMPTVWTDYDDSRDRFRHWNVEDFNAAWKGKRDDAAPATPSKTTTTQLKASKEAKVPAHSPIKPVAEPEANRPGLTTAATGAPSSGARPREELNRVLMNLYRPYLNQFPDTQFAVLLQNRYTVAETRLMSVEQLEDLVRYMETKLSSAA